MLQQTQVSRVQPKYVEFLNLWPTPGHLAGSELSDLLVFWVGLGYPQGTKSAFCSASDKRSPFWDEVPSTLPELMELPRSWAIYGKGRDGVRIRNESRGC